MKKEKDSNNGAQTLHRKLMIEQPEPHKKSESVELRCSGIGGCSWCTFGTRHVTKNKSSRML